MLSPMASAETTSATLPGPSAELRAARRKNRELRQLREARRIEESNRLMEAMGIGSTDWVGSFYAMIERFSQAQMNFMGATSVNDRRWGRNWPIFLTEQDLQIARMPSRLLTATNPYAIGL